MILAVNGAKGTSLREYRSAVDAAGSTVALLVQRGNAKVYVPVRIDS